MAVPGSRDSAQAKARFGLGDEPDVVVRVTGNATLVLRSPSGGEDRMTAEEYVRFPGCVRSEADQVMDVEDGVGAPQTAFYLTNVEPGEYRLLAALEEDTERLDVHVLRRTIDGKECDKHETYGGAEGDTVVVCLNWGRPDEVCRVVIGVCEASGVRRR